MERLTALAFKMRKFSQTTPTFWFQYAFVTKARSRLMLISFSMQTKIASQIVDVAFSEKNIAQQIQIFCELPSLPSPSLYDL